MDVNRSANLQLYRFVNSRAPSLLTVDLRYSSTLLVHHHTLQGFPRTNRSSLPSLRAW
jgi:hypothetical protein